MRSPSKGKVALIAGGAKNRTILVNGGYTTKRGPLRTVIFIAVGVILAALLVRLTPAARQSI